jgi:hypothetical protein
MVLLVAVCAALQGAKAQAQKVADTRRAFYVTKTEVLPTQAPLACTSGFHMASVFEILDVSNLRYDTTFGQTASDSGQGPVTFVFGWVRTGTSAYKDLPPGGQVGYQNCWGWTSVNPADYGTTVRLPGYWNTPTVTSIQPWQPMAFACSQKKRVWCVED